MAFSDSQPGLDRLADDLMGASAALRVTARAKLADIGRNVRSVAAGIAAQNGSTSIPGSLVAEPGGPDEYEVGTDSTIAGLWEYGNTGGGSSLTFDHPLNYPGQTGEVAQPRYPFLGPAERQTRDENFLRAEEAYVEALAPFDLGVD